jgi:hypothetical protein
VSELSAAAQPRDMRLIYFTFDVQWCNLDFKIKEQKVTPAEKRHLKADESFAPSVRKDLQMKIRYKV